MRIVCCVKHDHVFILISAAFVSVSFMMPPLVGIISDTEFVCHRFVPGVQAFKHIDCMLQHTASTRAGRR